MALNVGDAAILQGEIRALRAILGDDIEIDVAEQTPTVAQRLYPSIRFHAGLHVQHAHWPRWRSHGGVASLRKRRTKLAVWLLTRAPWLARALMTGEQRRHLKRIAAADVVVATGGTYFVEHYDFTAKAHEVLVAQALGKPTFLFTQSMGPFTRPKSQLAMRRIVAGSNGVFLRDTRSQGHLTSIGADASKLSVHSDAAFALATPQKGRPTQARALVDDAEAPRARVAISVRSWSHFKKGSGGDSRERYRRAVADCARTLARDGVEVTFLSTCQGVPEYWTDDSGYAAQLVDDLLEGERNVHVDAHFRTPEQLAEELRKYDVAIATRMHFAILALCVATPVVAIAYEFKSRELLRAMGREAWAFDIEDVTAEGLVRATREALLGGEVLRDDITKQVQAYREDAIGPARRIAETLGAVRGPSARATRAGSAQ